MRLQFSMFPHPTPEELFFAYLAGIVDGEGCITVRRSCPSGRNKSYRYAPVVMIVNTNREMLDAVVTGLGYGTVYLQKLEEGNRKTAWFLHFSHENALELLSGVLPYLRIKKHQAEILLRFPLMGKGNYNQYRSAPRARFDQQRQIYTEIRQLNAKGTQPPIIPVDVRR